MPYFCASSHFHPMPQSKARNKFKPCLTFLLTQQLVMPYYSLVAAKHTPPSSLRISQQQKHQQIICCGSSEAHGEYRRIWRNALTQRADDELVRPLATGATRMGFHDAGSGQRPHRKERVRAQPCLPGEANDSSERRAPTDNQPVIQALSTHAPASNSAGWFSVGQAT